jgi:SAM-dependent methyltransferase
MDLGGGMGAYALEMRKAGFQVLVVDQDAVALEEAGRQGLPVRQVLPSEDLGEDVADTVVMIEVLEHVADPAAFLNAAVRAARHRVLFTLPCIDDFEELFNLGLSYASIAVTDHLHHFSSEELRRLLGGAHCRLTLDLREPLSPSVAFEMLRSSFRWPGLGRLCLLPLLLLNKTGGLRRRFPTRCYGVVEKREAHDIGQPRLPRGASDDPTGFPP